MDLFILYKKLKSIKSIVEKSYISIKTYFSLDFLLSEEILKEIVELRKSIAPDLLKFLELYQKNFQEMLQPLAKQIIEFLDSNVEKWRDKNEELTTQKNKIDELIEERVNIVRNSIIEYNTILLKHLFEMIADILESNSEWTQKGKAMAEQLSKILKHEDKFVNEKILASSKELFIESKNYSPNKNSILMIKIGSFLEDISLFVESLKDELLTQKIQEKMREILLRIKKMLDMVSSISKYI